MRFVDNEDESSGVFCYDDDKNNNNDDFKNSKQHNQIKAIYNFVTNNTNQNHWTWNWTKHENETLIGTKSKKDPLEIGGSIQTSFNNNWAKNIANNFNLEENKIFNVHNLVPHERARLQTNQTETNNKNFNLKYKLKPKTLTKILKENNHNYLKKDSLIARIDLHGSEWLFLAMAEQTDLSKFKQILVKFYHPSIAKISDKLLLQTKMIALKRIRQMNFVMADVRADMRCFLDPCFDVLFVRLEDNEDKECFDDFESRVTEEQMNSNNFENKINKFFELNVTNFFKNEPIFPKKYNFLWEEWFGAFPNRNRQEHSFVEYEVFENEDEEEDEKDSSYIETQNNFDVFDQNYFKWQNDRIDLENRKIDFDFDFDSQQVPSTSSSSSNLNFQNKEYKKHTKEFLQHLIDKLFHFSLNRDADDQDIENYTKLLSQIGISLDDMTMPSFSVENFLER